MHLRRLVITCRRCTFSIFIPTRQKAGRSFPQSVYSSFRDYTHDEEIDTVQTAWKLKMIFVWFSRKKIIECKGAQKPEWDGEKIIAEQVTTKNDHDQSYHNQSDHNPGDHNALHCKIKLPQKLPQLQKDCEQQLCSQKKI